MIKPVRDYIATIQNSSKYDTILQYRHILPFFTSWIESNNKGYYAISNEQLEMFYTELLSHFSYSTFITNGHRKKIFKFLVWLKYNTYYTVNLYRFSPEYGYRGQQIPPEAIEYLSSQSFSLVKKNDVENTLKIFYLNCGNLYKSPSLGNFERIKTFKFYIENYKTEQRKQTYYRHLRVYLNWHFEKGSSKHYYNGKLQRDIYLLPLEDNSDVKFYLLTQKAIATKQTYTATKVSLRNFLAFLKRNDLQSKKLNRSAIEQWLNYLFEKKYAQSTKLGYILEVRKYLRWLKAKGKLKKDIIYISDLPKLPKYLPRPLSPNIDSILKKTLKSNGDIYSLGLLLMRVTGARIGELRELRITNYITNERGHDFIKIPLGKMNNERMIPLDSEGKEVVEKILAIRKNHFQLIDKYEDKAYLITNRYGGRASLKRLQEKLQDISEKHNLPVKITSHQLRHTFATSLLNNGMSIYGLMKLLGHKQIATTLIYAEVSKDKIYSDFLEIIEKEYNKIATNCDKISTIDSFILNIASIKKHLREIESKEYNNRKTKLLLKRLDRLKQDILELE